MFYWTEKEIKMELSRDENAINTNCIDPNAEDFEKIKVHYVCGGKWNSRNSMYNNWSFHSIIDCGKDNTLDKETVVRCTYCGHRIFYKKRERKLLQYEAR